MNKLNFQTKSTGDTLEAQEWNQVVNKVDELVEASNNGGGGTVIDSKLLHSAQIVLLIDVTFLGIFIDNRLEQRRNAYRPIVVTF